MIGATLNESAFGLHFLYEIVYFSTFYFNSNFIWFHINNINFNHTNVCVFFSFLCGVWKEPCKRTKKKIICNISNETKQKRNYFRNEKCLRVLGKENMKNPK